ncbi:hypothetical protein BJY52DRAFT_570105 [Lactarius psammicola]|nr:hypothetical protein BJY52DRAFT_570105 [Lactarius psammicola]
MAPATRNETDELEYLESAFEPPRGNGSSSTVDSFPCLGPRLTTKSQAILPPLAFYSRVGKATGPSSLPSPVASRRNRSRLSEITFSTASDPKHRNSARDVSLSPAMVEPMARRDYLAPIMAVLDELHAIVKSNVHSRFESITSDVAKLRRQILAQTQADMSALLDEYVQQTCKSGGEVWRFLEETNRSLDRSPECQYARLGLPARAHPGARPHNASAPPACLSCRSFTCGGSTLAVTTMLASLSLVLIIVISVLLPCSINAGRSHMYYLVSRDVLVSFLRLFCFCLVPIGLRIDVRRFLMRFALFSAFWTLLDYLAS